jgi:twitching motility protein PilT
VSSPEGFSLPVRPPDDGGLPTSPPDDDGLPTTPPDDEGLSARPQEVPPHVSPPLPPITVRTAEPEPVVDPTSSATSRRQRRAESPKVRAPEPPPAAGASGIVVTERKDAIGGGEPEISIDEALLYLLDHGGSDLHLTVNAPPMIRVHGDLEPIPGHRPLTMRQIQESVYAVLTERQKQRFEEDRELDFAYEMPGAARFRVNLMFQRGAIAAVLRAIPWDILPLEALGMPAEVGDLAQLPRGLVLVTGPTGSGKSTTLAAVIDRANRTRKGHIVTVEDPIEFVHPHRQCVVNQREVGQDTLSFQEALRHALRQDPDIILVGEMRDLETIAIALTAAETGHLVFGTLHTSSAGSTIDRIIDVFPPAQQSQVRTQLANSLKAVVCQTLCRKAEGSGRVAATEVMMATPAIRNLIREGKLQSIPSALQTGSAFGMHTLNQDLARLVTEGTITYETALSKCSDAAELNQLLGRSGDADD